MTDRAAPLRQLVSDDGILEDLKIEKLVAGGDGLGFAAGVPVFVPRSAPGDRLRVRIAELRRDYARAEIAEIVESGRDRIAPRCRHYQSCGGCDLQHLDYRAQVRAKVEACAETLKRLGRRDLPAKVRVVAGDPWHYRLRTTLHRSRADSELKATDVGYLAAGSHDVVAVGECPVLVPELENIVRLLPESLVEHPSRRIDLAAGDGGAVTSSPPGGNVDSGAITVAVGDFEYEFDARCFFQTHRGLLSDLVEAVVPARRGSETNREHESVVELYAGVGLFTLPLARGGSKVMAVEGDRIAGRYLRRNARRNKVDNVEVVSQAVETWISNLSSSEGEACGRIVVDPPRRGLPVEVRRAINRAAIPEMTYVSCHPATLARDLLAFSTYEIEEIIFLDLFPQTGHIETVVHARRS